MQHDELNFEVMDCENHKLLVFKAQELREQLEERIRLLSQLDCALTNVEGDNFAQRVEAQNHHLTALLYEVFEVLDRYGDMLEYLNTDIQRNLLVRRALASTN